MERVEMGEPDTAVISARGYEAVYVQFCREPCTASRTRSIS